MSRLISKGSTVMLAALFGGAAILVAFSFVTAPWLIMLMIVAFALVAEMYRKRWRIETMFQELEAHLRAVGAGRMR